MLGSARTAYATRFDYVKSISRVKNYFLKYLLTIFKVPKVAKMKIEFFELIFFPRFFSLRLFRGK